MKNAQRYRVMTLLGTRPEIIRLSRVIPRLDEVFDHTLVHTGQNSGEHLSDVFFRELELRAPDIFLDAPTNSLGQFLGTAFGTFEKVLSDNEPEALLILGDTNSALLGVLAKRMGIPVYHMEAGNRSFDSNVPEEANRRIVDHFSDFNLVYTEHARRNLIAEGLHPRFILKTGSPMREVLNHYQPAIDESPVLRNLCLEPQKYFVVSAHRQENVDFPQRLSLLVESLQALTADWGLPIIVSTHPRTRQRLEDASIENLSPLINFHQPFGLFDYLALQKNALCVLSDSGTISEEAAILGFKAVTIRDSMERPEALDSATVMMSGLTPKNISVAIQAAIHSGPPECPHDYLPANCSDRVVSFLVSTIERAATWSGRFA